MGFLNGINWDSYKISALLAAIGALILGIISLLKNSRNRLNITIAFFNFLVMMLVMVLFFLRVVKDPDTANAIVKYLAACMLFLPVVFLRFTVIFTKSDIKWVNIIYYCLLFSSIALVIMSLLDIGTKSLVYKKEGDYFVAQPDLVYAIFNYNLIFGIASGLYLLIDKFLSPGIQPIEKKQTQYLLVAFTILGICGITNQLDIFGVKIPPMAVFGAFFYILTMTYAALTYDLLQVKELLAKVLAYVLVAFGFSALGVILIITLGSVNDLNTKILIGLPAGAVIFVFINWLNKTLQRLSGRILLSNTDYDLVIRLMQEKTESITRIADVTAEINGIVSGAMQIENMSFAIRYGRENNFLDDRTKVTLADTNPLIKLLREKKSRVYFEELNNRLYYSTAGEGEKNPVREMLGVFNRFGAEMCLPVFIRNDLRGVWFIGGKKSKNILSREEYKFLDNALYLLSVRMENIMLYEQLAGAERLTMLGRMAAAVAHEIRNPLTGLGSFVQMIIANTGNREKVVEKFLQIAPPEFKRLEKLTDNLLALSHNTRLNLAPADLNGLIDEINEFVAHIYRKNRIEVVRNYGGIQKLEIDREQIRQVILNLIVNATQAMPDGGTIEFITGARALDTGHNVYVSVRDTGPGIPPEIQDRIFDPFYTTKAEGTGLGLAICRNIMQAHGGFIEMESSSDKGSVFTICFPVRD